MPKLISEAKNLKGRSREELKEIVNSFNNDLNLRECIKFIIDRLMEISNKKLVLDFSV